MREGGGLSSLCERCFEGNPKRSEDSLNATLQPGHYSASFTYSLRPLFYFSRAAPRNVSDVSDCVCLVLVRHAARVQDCCPRGVARGPHNHDEGAKNELWC